MARSDIAGVRMVLLRESRTMWLSVWGKMKIMEARAMAM